VDSFIPEATFAPDGKPPRMFSERDVAPGAGDSTADPRLGGGWWLLVVAPLALAPLVVLGMWLFALGRRRRRARAVRGRAEVMPSLPARAKERITTGE
jgi:hypothetical protein